MMIGGMANGKTQRDAAALVSMRPETMRDLVHRLALDTTNIRWSIHALQRMDERGITDLVAVDVLRRGDLKGEIEPGQSSGEWKAKMVHAVKGRREVGVVVLTIRNAKLFVKTVEWEDVR